MTWQFFTDFYLEPISLPGIYNAIFMHGIANFPTNVRTFNRTVFTFLLGYIETSRPSSGVPHSRESCVPVPYTVLCTGCFFLQNFVLPVFVFALGQSELNTGVVHVCLDHTAWWAISAPGVAYNWHKALNFYLILKKTLSSIRISLVHFNPIDHVFSRIKGPPP